jgi:uncharacterized protein YjbI with pentapeptide repeats
MKLWTFLTTDIRELNWKQAEDVTKTGAEAAKAVFDLGKALQEQGSKAEVLKNYVGQISSLLDVLNSPLGQVVKDTIPFAPIAISLIKLITEATKREPTLEECMMLVSQAAYLESLRSLLKPYTQKLEQVGQKQASEAIARQLKQLGTREFSSQDAQDALLQFPNSRLAEAFNAILVPRLQETGFPKGQASTLANRVVWNTHRYIHQALAKESETLKPLAELYRNGGREVLEKYQSLEHYLKTQICPLPEQVIFQEEATTSTDLQVTYKDLYVPLNGQPLDCDGKKLEDAAPIELATWVAQVLQDSRKTKHLMFIQGEAGRGKSVFCRMFADQVWQAWYPSYTPILIRLRGLRTLSNRLQDTLASSPELQNCDFVTSDPGWLTDRNIRFLFLLDGFDELLLREGGATGGLKELLEQVEQFQQNSHHRFVITGRPLALLQVERLISQTRNLERIEVQPMDDRLTQAWARKWATKVGQEETQNFWQFLKACPEDVQTLAREPLLMYLLARMHREQRLTVQMFAGAEEQQAKIQIYDAAVEWVLEKQRQTENSRLTGLEPAELRQFLTEAATCVVQAGNEIAPVAMLETRLASHNPAAKLLEKSRQEMNLEDSKALNNLLASFYLKPTSGEKGGCIEFVHKSFGEFLFAERLLEALEDWAEPGVRRHEKFLIEDAKMHRELYDLLGYGGLTPEIVNFLTPRLVKQLSDKSLITLFQRLNDFYDRWCEGEFIDADPPTLPQQTMRLLKEQGVLGIGQRQVDVYTGLNTMILLLELHRHGQEREILRDKIAFYPSGQLLVDSDRMDYTDRLLKVINYSDAMKSMAFTKIAGPFLVSANLADANFVGSILFFANFSRANLIGANFFNTSLFKARFISVNLTNANLVSTYLNSANLTHANLTRANLEYANLKDADLEDANLTKANLEGAILKDTNLEDANLEGANLTNVNLDHANLCGANLIRTNLTRAYLGRSNLERANLSHSNLSSANLVCTNFTSANLQSTQLCETNLESACFDQANLSHAELDSANFKGAYLRNANLTDANLENTTWDEETRWEEVKGLETARNVPEALKQQLKIKS